MTLHPFLRLCVHGVVPSSCTSLALQPAAGVQHPCSKSFLISRHPLHPPQKSNAGQDKRKRHHSARKALSAHGLARHALGVALCRRRRGMLA
jgi:hypothetical protein